MGRKQRILNFCKRIFHPAGAGENLPQCECQCQTERFGSQYGGWEVVVAGMHAGMTVYSVGIGEDASFDMALISRFGMTIEAFDPTPKSIAWVKMQQFPPAFRLHEYGLAAQDGEVTFYPPKNPNHVSYTLLDRPETKQCGVTAPVKRLATIMQELGHTHIDLLKMDIEGAEYNVLDDLAKSTIRPTQLLVEFHDRFPGVGEEKTIAAIRQLQQIGYKIFAISPSREEYCFILL